MSGDSFFDLPAAGVLRFVPAALLASAAAVLPWAGRRSAAVALLVPGAAAAFWLQGGARSFSAVAAVVAACGVVTVRDGRGRAGLALAAAGTSLWAAAWTVEGAFLLPVAAVGAATAGLWMADRDARGRGVLLVWAALAGLCLALAAARPEAAGLPSKAVRVVEDQFRSRSAVPVAGLLVMGLSLWPLGGLRIAAARSDSETAGFAAAMLAALTAAVVVRCDAGSGELALAFGLFTAAVATLLCLAQSDLRSKVVAALAAVGGHAAVAYAVAPAAVPTLVGAASLSAAVGLGVVGRLRERYGSSEVAAYRGLARRHPTASLLLAGSLAGLVACVAGPIALGGVLPAAAARSQAVAWSLLCLAWLLAAGLAATLTPLLFGSTRVPEFRGPVFERVEVPAPPRRPLAGPASTLAWAAGLLLAAVVLLGRS